MVKKAKGKAKKKSKNSAKAEEVRLAALRVVEDEAEELQRRENERREREEQDERMSLIREEQLRLIREKERRIEELGAKVTEVCDALKDDRYSFESQIAHLSVLRDSLLNEVSLLKAEMDERQQIFSQERENMVIRVEKFRSDNETMRANYEEEKTVLREQLHIVSSTVEEQRVQLEIVVEERESNDREYIMKIKALERELEKALTINKTLQSAIEEREADDKKNITLMQLLNAQLDESRRHFQEQLEDERQRTNRAREECLALEAKCANTQEELEVVRSEHAESTIRASTELREYQQQLEQMKFDAEYLNSEIETMRTQCSEAVRDAENAREAAEADAKNCLVEMEALQKKVDDLEALLHRKEREHFDKVTFLNAQITNNRTAVAQLQQRLNDEREGYEVELARCTADMHQTVEEMERIGEKEAVRAKERKQREDRLLSDISILKTTVFQLQAALEEKERGFNVVCDGKNEEIKRLQDILDAHFIPHRKDVEVSRSSRAVDQAAKLRDSLKEVQREASLKEQAAMETEIWMKARIANQAEVIEQLQQDLRKAELLRFEEVRALSDELARFKKTMDIHFVPYPV